MGFFWLALRTLLYELKKDLQTCHGRGAAWNVKAGTRLILKDSIFGPKHHAQLRQIFRGTTVPAEIERSGGEDPAGLGGPREPNIP